MDGPIEFVFSFRSPFVWIASRAMLPLVDPSVEIRWVPFYPLPEFENFGRELVKGKLRHNVSHLMRMAKLHGLRFGDAPIDEPDWATSHTAFLAADRAGRGSEFGQAMLDERWEQGNMLGEPETIRRAAETAGLSPDDIEAASRDPKLQAELIDVIRSNYDDRGFFGVPMLVLPDDSRFWGQDTIEWGLRHGYVPSAVGFDA